MHRAIDLPGPKRLAEARSGTMRDIDIEELLTALVDRVFALLHLRLKWSVENDWFLWDISTALSQDGELVSGYLKVSDRFPMNLVHTAGTDVAGIPG